MEKKHLTTDLLIIGGGTAGCYAAITAARMSQKTRILLAEKANILRSGCLAAGVNALNAYIHEGQTVEDYVEFVRWDAEQIIREDLVRSMAAGFNEAAQDLEKMGLVIQKDETGRYAARGKQNIKINGENIKPILAAEVARYKNIRVLNHVNFTDLLRAEAKAEAEAEAEAVPQSGGNPPTAKVPTSSASFEKPVQRKDTKKDTEEENDAPDMITLSSRICGAVGLSIDGSTAYARIRGDVGSSQTSSSRICGAVGLSIDGSTAYAVEARAVLIATGGAAGLYRPNNPGFSRHKMWYPPFNTGAGYAMGIRAGAEMTSFEMRFVAQRCKDTIAPTGTIALGVGAKEINARGEIFEKKYGLSTSGRAYGATNEVREGRGPCYLRTEGISAEQDMDLLKAYLNMAPAQTLRWIESGRLPSQQNVEVEGTEPYIVGGHTGSGYWIDVCRRTTLPGLYAAGDVAGGAPKKFVTGAMAEGRIAAETILKDLCSPAFANAPAWECLDGQAEAVFADYKRHLPGTGVPREPAAYDVFSLEEAMQKVMDEYAGGIKSAYRYNAGQLALAGEKIARLTKLAEVVRVQDAEDLYRVYELRDRLTICRSLLFHMQERTETRWPGFGIHMDFPKCESGAPYFVNSVLRDGRIRVFRRQVP